MTPEQRAALVEKADKRIAELLGEDSTAINRPRHMLTIEVIDLIRNEVLEEAHAAVREKLQFMSCGCLRDVDDAIRALKETK